MGGKNRIKCKINNTEFVISADDDREYIAHICTAVDERIAALEKEHHNLSNSMATVLAALNYCDELEKEKKVTAELLKRTEECAAAEQKAKESLEGFAVENEQLKEEKQGLHARIEELKAELASVKNAHAGQQHNNQQNRQPGQQRQPGQRQARPGDSRQRNQNGYYQPGAQQGVPQQRQPQQPLPKINYQDNDKISEEYRREDFQDPATEDEMLSFFDNR